jgi:hypothetical protein
MDRLPAFSVYLPSPLEVNNLDDFLVEIFRNCLDGAGYKLALRTPGNSPFRANCRKQMRQSPVYLI